MLDLSVVIVNYNASYFLQLCLDALQVALVTLDAEVIVVDNQSSDDSCVVLAQKYPWVSLIQNEENEGFGKANNRGVSQAKGAHVLLLNPDTIVSEATLLDALYYLKDNAQVGAVGVKMLDGSGTFLPESKRGLPTPRVAFYKAFGCAKLFPKSAHFSRYYMGHLSEDEKAHVEILAGAFMMLPKQVYEVCKGFDEAFFMYGEDVDLSYRITQMGYANAYLPSFPIVHFKGESASRDALWAERFYGAMHLFSQKHFSHQGRFFSALLHFGIVLRKHFSKAVKRVESLLPLADLDLIIVGHLSDYKLGSAFVSQFKSHHYQRPEDLDISLGNALLFMPDVDKAWCIVLMQNWGAQKTYFWSSADITFALASPSSESQGQVFHLS